MAEIRWRWTWRWLRVCCVFTLGFNILVMHMRKWDDRGSFDISYPLQLSTQKLIIIAFSLNDGCARKEEELNPWQKKNKLKQVPSLTEIFGYVLYFGGVFLGPGFFFEEYKEFINGENIQFNNNEKTNTNNVNGKKYNTNMDSEYAKIKAPIMKKSLLALTSLAIFLLGDFYLPPKKTTDVNFMKSQWLLVRCLVVFVSVFCNMHRVDVIFQLGEMIQNASGLGLHFVNGNPEWDLTTSMNMSAFRRATKMSDIIKNWNLFTSKWLRHCFYERSEKWGLPLAFAVNYIWHGPDFGYFVASHVVCLAVVVARKVRRSIRPLVLGTRWKILYDIITWLAAHATLYYAMVAFFLLDGKAVLQYYTYSLYWCVHIALIILIIIPLPVPAKENK